MIKSKELLKKSSYLIIALLLVIALITSVNAAGADSIGFSVSPIIPENQVDGVNTGYFDLRVKPGDSQVLQLIAKNDTSEEKSMEVEAVNASTSIYGEVSYSSDVELDESLKNPISEIATVEKDIITVPANSETTINIKLDIPQEEFDGIKLGGIRVKDITARLKREAGTTGSEMDEPEDNTQGIKIYNEYEYILGLVLSENDNAIAPDFELLDIYPESLNYESVIRVPFRNPQPRTVGKALFSGEISDKSGNPFFSIENYEFDMAPNSVYNYTFFDTAGIGVKNGDYHFTGKIEFDGKVWDFDQNFTIDREEAESINKQAVNQQQHTATSSGVPVWLIVVIIIGVLILVALILLIILLKKKKTVIDIDDLKPSN